MSRNIRLHEIDQFSKATTVPEAAIGDDVLRGVRKLNERTELEPAIQDILFDPNETPHGPTEVADIYTSKLIVKGEKMVAGLILKGRSFQKVKSQDIDHQIMKARRIPDVGLLALIAVGSIHDSAHTDFVQTALDAECDYIVLDAVDIARLLIAYDQICPHDGTRYRSDGVCAEGHKLDDGTSLEVEVAKEIDFEIPQLRDVSHGTAKRYSAVIMVDRHYSRDVMREVIEKATRKIKTSTYHRNSRVAERWSGTDTDVVWLFLASDLSDIRDSNWRARTLWIRSGLDEAARPHEGDFDEDYHGIGINWNESYQQMKKFYAKHSGDKGEVVARLDDLVEEAISIGEKAIRWFRCYQDGKYTEEALVAQFDRLRERESELYKRSGDLPFPPHDVDDYDEVCQSLFAHLDNMFLYYSEEGLEQWQESNREYLMSETTRDFRRDIKRVEYERDKLS